MKKIDFVIEKGIPIPPRATTYNTTRASLYPFGSMEVGDSAFFKGPLEKKQLVRIVGAWGRITKVKGFRFVSRRDNTGGIRVWRKS